MRGVAGVLVAAAVAACQPTGARPPATATSPDSADQVILAMVTEKFDQAVRTTRVTADTSFYFQAAQRMDLRNLRVDFFENGKKTSTLTANRGDYQVTTGSLDARGNVVVVSDDGRRLTTPHLIYDKSANQLRSDTVFYYVSADGDMTGKRFTSDLGFTNVVVTQPKGRQRGTGVLIPGQ